MENPGRQSLSGNTRIAGCRYGLLREEIPIYVGDTYGGMRGAKIGNNNRAAII
ncbi:MAG: hypothetical protein NVS9B4_10900 [Candidatus Acidiferrum sp.]